MWFRVSLFRLSYKNYYLNKPVFNTAAFSDPGRFAVGDAARNESSLRIRLLRTRTLRWPRSSPLARRRRASCGWSTSTYSESQADPRALPDESASRLRELRQK